MTPSQIKLAPQRRKWEEKVIETCETCQVIHFVKTFLLHPTTGEKAIDRSLRWLISLFNGMSTFVIYLMPTPSL